MSAIISISDQLRRDEGTRLRLYQDTAGKWTIGTGRNLTDDGISMAEADVLLENDITNVTNGILGQWPWVAGLDSVRLGVLQNMAFNMGVGGLGQFRDTLEKVRDGDYAGAAQAMLQSRWAQQIGARAQRLSIQMESGNWQ